IQFWNSRDVFCGSPSPFVRSEKDHHREQLAFALRNWSLGRQKDLSCDLSQIIPPVLWIAGEHDRRFVELGHDFQRIAANINFVAVRGAAHRVPWENTREFTEELLKFLRRT